MTDQQNGLSARSTDSLGDLVGMLVILAVVVGVSIAIGSGVIHAIRDSQEYDTGRATLDGTPILVALGVWIVIGGCVGFAIGGPRGRPFLGFWLGVLLGVLGWIVVALIEPTAEVTQRRSAEAAVAMKAVFTETLPETRTRPCPWCAEDIKPAAKVCRFCGRDVEPIPIATTVAPQSSDSTAQLDHPSVASQLELSVSGIRANPWLLGGGVILVVLVVGLLTQ